MSAPDQEPEGNPAGLEAGLEGAAPPVKPTQMLPLERQVGWLIVAVAIGAVLASHASDALNGSSTALGQAAVGGGLIILMAGAIWYGHRIWAAFAALVAGFAPLSPSLVYLSFFSLGYGAYLMFKASRAQAKAAATRPRRQPRQRRARGAPTGSGSATKSRTGAGRTGAGDTGRPSANRRYTPPRSKDARRGR
jgi:hypothetical protein